MIFGERRLTREDLGREQVRARFAWRPMRLANGAWVWGERVIQHRFVVRHVDVYFPPPLWDTCWTPRWGKWKTYTVEQFAERTPSFLETRHEVG